MPVFLTLDEALRIHRDQLARYGGAEGIADVGLLQSALAQPMATYSGRFSHEDVFEMAAAYLFHLVQNHPFVDGNKRVGAVAAMVSLELNGAAIELAENELESLVWRVAQGTADKATVAAAFRERAI